MRSHRYGKREAYVAAVEAIYATAGHPSLWPETLQSIADAFGGVGGHLIWARDDGSTVVVGTPSLRAAEEEYNQKWWQEDIRYKRTLERGYLAATDTLTDRDLVSEEEIETHPFYAYLGRHGMRWAAMTTICPDPRLWVGLTIHRSSAKAAFTDQELARISRLCRHAENALRISIRVLDAELARLALAEALARLGIGVFLVDGLGRVTWANPRADDLLGDGLLKVSGRLSARFAPEREGLEKALAAALSGEPAMEAREPAPVLLHGTTSRDFLAIYVLPVRPPDIGAVADILAGVRAMVVAIPSRTDAPPDPSLVRHLLDVTLGEARVASLVGVGFTPADAASRLGISEETARTVLKRVFAKVGVSRQSELSALLSRLVLR